MKAISDLSSEEMIRRLAPGRGVLDQVREGIIAHSDRMTGLGHRASKFCSRGCARCCSMIFFVSPPEVDVIALHLLENPQLLELFLRNSAWREKRVAEVSELYRHCQSATQADDPALRAFYGFDIRCAFNSDGDCFIYPVRPLSCSLYNSIVPAATCATEPKAYETEEMRLHHGEMRRWLASHSRHFANKGEERLDVSRKVLKRLEMLCV